MPRGVTWSKRMSIHGGVWSGKGGRVRIETAGGKFKYRIDLLACDVELVNDLVYGGSGLEVLEYGGDGHSGIAKYPCPA
jgi:hypothetical protein